MKNLVFGSFEIGNTGHKPVPQIQAQIQAQIRAILMKIKYRDAQLRGAAAWPRFHCDDPFGGAGAGGGPGAGRGDIHWTKNFVELVVDSVRADLLKLRDGSGNTASDWIGEYDEIPITCKRELSTNFMQTQAQILDGTLAELSPGRGRTRNSVYRIVYMGSTNKMSSVTHFHDSVLEASSANDSINFMLRALAAIKSKPGPGPSKLRVDFKQVLIDYANRDQKYPRFLILFKSSDRSANIEKDGIKVMKPPLNDRVSGSGHDSSCFIYYVFMHKDLQEFWKLNTKLEGAKRHELLTRLGNKH